MAAAQTGRDTTIIVNQQRIVVTTHKGETHVAVYDSTDNQLLKTRETVFANLQEVERVNVTSPFLPSTYTRAAALAPILPTVWYAYTSTDSKIGSDANSSSGLHTRGSGSSEVGVTIFEGITPLTDRGRWGQLGFSMGAQTYYTWMHFQPGSLLQGEGSHVSFTPAASAASTNRLSYGGVRIPLMLSCQIAPDNMASQIAIGISADMRTRGKYRFTPADMGDPIERNVRLKPFGLNLETVVCFGPLAITGRVGLLPLFQTTTGKKAYTSSIGIGINMGQLFRRR